MNEKGKKLNAKTAKKVTVTSVRKEIKRNVRKCIEMYSELNDRYLKDLEGDVILIVDEAFSKLEKNKKFPPKHNEA